MSTLFIIGNGFDCHFDLKTKVSDFKSYLSQKYTYDGYNILEVFESYGVDWGEYEESISLIELREIEERILYPDYQSDHETDRDGGILEMEMFTRSMRDGIFSALNDMIENANADLATIPLQLPFFEMGDAILSFNYTSTVEQLFFNQIKIPILHIHGFYEENENLLFGYQKEDPTYEDRLKNMSDEDHDYYVDEQQDRILKFYKSLRKNLRLDRLKSFLDNFSFDKVVVLGHSMSCVDNQYMELIEQEVGPSLWEISIYRDSPSDGQLSSYSFSSRIRKIKIEDYLM